MAEPPSDVGAVKAMFVLPFPAVTVPIMGMPGTVAGVTVMALEGTLVPFALVAVTLQL